MEFGFLISGIGEGKEKERGSKGNADEDKSGENSAAYGNPGSAKLFKRLGRMSLACKLWGIRKKWMFKAIKPTHNPFPPQRRICIYRKDRALALQELSSGFPFLNKILILYFF